MPEQDNVLLAIGLMAAIVYLTRACGYFIGLQFRHIGGLRPILEALPGCAIMAILLPAVRQGDLVDLLSLICVLGLMWKTDNVVLATVVGLAVLLFGAHLIDGIQTMFLQ